MATEVIHEHDSHAESSNGASFLIGVIILAVVVLFMLYYGVNFFRGMGNSSPTIQVPDKVNVNLNQGGNSK